MSASAATRLRQLASQYHGGELDLQSYRRLRAELLDRLTIAEADVDEGSPTLPQRPRPQAAPPMAAAPLESHAPAAPKSPKASPAAIPHPPSIQQVPTSARSRSATTLVVIALVVVAVAGAAGYFYLHSAPVAASSASDQEDTTSESYLAISDFLAADDWSDEQVANFNSRWATLPGDMHEQALDRPWYQNFVERVRAQVKERRALTATADSPGSVEGPLSSLARSVGIDIAAPDSVVSSHSHANLADAEATREKESPDRASPHQPAKPALSAAGEVASNLPVKNAIANPPAPSAAKPGSSAARPAAAAGAAANAQQKPPDTHADRCRSELVNSRKPRCRDSLTLGGFGPYLAVIPAGSFEMGSKQVAQEQPVHRVTIAKPFAIAEFEASQAEYRLFCTQTSRACEAQPWAGDDLPVVSVSWEDARDYAAWLSTVTGNTYRLATEAEWEYAARSGGGALFPSGDALSQTDAVFSASEKLSAPWPRSKKINANAFRLYHTIGNVREWVEDAWASSYAGAPGDGTARETGDTAFRVVRGGAYTDLAPKLRFTTREGIKPSTRDETTGFRVVREM